MTRSQIKIVDCLDKKTKKHLQKSNIFLNKLLNYS